MEQSQSPLTSTSLLFVGRFKSRKGIDILLSIVPHLLVEFPGLQIDIVGNDRIAAIDGSNYRASFEEIHRHEHYASRIVFHGEVENEILRSFYANCDLFVSPSRYESFGLVFVEAMMYAKPVVGCSVGGMIDVIADGETGLLATPENANPYINAFAGLSKTLHCASGWAPPGASAMIGCFAGIAWRNKSRLC